jgi:hypothetical protein
VGAEHEERAAGFTEVYLKIHVDDTELHGGG